MTERNSSARDSELEQLHTMLAKAQLDLAVATTKIDFLTRTLEDLRVQNYRLEAQYTESRIGRAVADERAAAAREAAARAQACCPCECHRPDYGSPRPQPKDGTKSGQGGEDTETQPDSESTQPPQKKLVIDRMIVQQTPQSGTWLMCFMAKAQSGVQNVFNVPNQTYEGDGITIDMNCVLSPIAAGERISFKCQLDDDQADVCGNGAEDKSGGEFLASVDGSQAFSFDNWVYSLYWHMETA